MFIVFFMMNANMNSNFVSERERERKHEHKLDLNATENAKTVVKWPQIIEYEKNERERKHTKSTYRIWTRTLLFSHEREREGERERNSERKKP